MAKLTTIISVAFGVGIFPAVGYRQEAQGRPPAEVELKKALRNRSIENMKTIALALQNYHEAHGSFPPAVLRTGEGGPPYSSHMAILPFMGQKGKDLYRQYHFDEPWDGPNNRKLLEQIPLAYRLPIKDHDPTYTSYFALTGPGTVFSGNKGTALADIRDDPTTTILFVEWKKPVPWTKPEDIPYTGDEPLSKVGGYHDTCALQGAFGAAFVDGAVRFISATMSDDLVSAFITKAGGEKLPSFPK